MSFKGSPNESNRISIVASEDETVINRDYSLISLTSTGSQDEFFRCRDHAESTLKRMQSYLDNLQLCDVVLCAGLDGKK